MKIRYLGSQGHKVHHKYHPELLNQKIIIKLIIHNFTSFLESRVCEEPFFTFHSTLLAKFRLGHLGWTGNRLEQVYESMKLTDSANFKHK